MHWVFSFNTNQTAFVWKVKNLIAQMVPNLFLIKAFNYQCLRATASDH